MKWFSVSQTFKSLKYRNFRLYFFAQMMSLMGSWMQGTAQSWLLWRLTRSEGLLGLLGFAQMGPVLILGLFGGLLADRMHRKKLLLITQSFALSQAALLAALAMSGLITPLHIFILAAMLGTINAFDMTARQTFLGDMVEREDMGNAIALNSLLFNIARVIAPPISGFIIARYGESLCFALNAVSFLFVLIALLLMNIEKTAVESTSGSPYHSLKEGLKYLMRDPVSGKVLLLLMTVSFLLLPYGYFMPYFADSVLGGKARMLGTLLSSTGLGALLGALVMARNHKITKLPFLLGASCLAMGMDLALFSLSRTVYLSIPLLFCAGFTTMIAASSTNIFLQTNAPPELRGRIISFYVTAFIGFPPVGGMVSGYFAESYGTINVLFLCALITMIISGIYLALIRKGQPSVSK